MPISPAALRIESPRCVRVALTRAPKEPFDSRQSRPRKAMAAGTCFTVGAARFTSQLRYVATLTPISYAASHCSKPRDQRRSRKAAPSVPVAETLVRS